MNYAMMYRRYALTFATSIVVTFVAVYGVLTNPIYLPALIANVFANVVFYRKARLYQSKARKETRR